jgi:hypothetical protein
MAVRNPLVIISGVVQELPSGDTINGASGGSGADSISFFATGTVTVPLTGTARRYFSASRSFTKATIGVSSAPSTTLTATIKKNGSSVGTITVSSAAFYNTNSQSFSVVAGDYLTVDVSGANTENLILTLE